MMTAEELLELVLNHPEATAEVEEEVVVLATTSA
jgi:hypothetical protein